MKANIDSSVKAHIKVKLIWGGTGESKPAEVALTETAGDVFKEVYEVFHQKPTDQDTYEVNGKDFARAKFAETVQQIVHEFGRDLAFEVSPPTSGA